MRRRLGAALMLTLLLAAGSLPAGAAPLAAGRYPLAGRPAVVRGFAPPERDWLPGHRGVDLAAPVGSRVLAAAAGRVTYAGTLAGRGVVVVDHGRVRTTYEPVEPQVPVGARVAAGDPIGVLSAGHACPVETCLHWGLREGERYLNPLTLVGIAGPVRLLPLSAAASARGRAEARRERAVVASSIPPGGGPAGSAGVPAGPAGPTGLIRPAAGPVTSRFGMRRHPVLGVWKLHDGIDYGTGCGAPLLATAPGRVTGVSYNIGYGNRLFVDHGTVGGRRITTSYNHASRYLVRPGDTVTAGQNLGLSGSTGFSTGCHLHFMMWVDGRLVDPGSWL